MKIKIPAFFFALLCCTGAAFAQSSNWGWAAQGAGSSSDEGYAVCTDPSGNVFVTGFFTSPTLTFGSVVLTHTNASDIFLVKYDPNGNVVWAKSVGGTGVEVAYGITSDQAGNIFITGSFDDTLAFGNITVYDSTGSANVFLAKYDPSGNALWATSAGGLSPDAGNSVSVDAAGNTYITGYFTSSSISFGNITLNNTGWQDAFIAKYDAAGNAIWARSNTGSGHEFGNAVAADAFGNLYVTGIFSDSVSFGNFPLTDPGAPMYDAFFVKYDTSGNVLWARSAGGPGDDRGFSITCDNTGKIYASGSFFGPSIVFGSTTLTSAGSYDAFITKFDPAGNVLWAKSAGGTMIDYGFSIATDAANNVFVSGRADSPVFTIGTTSLNQAGNAYDPMFVAELDSAGKLSCADLLPSGGDDQNAICTDTSGNAFIAGDFMVSPFVVGNTTLTLANVNSENIFAAKWKCAEGTGVPEETGIVTAEVFPNPFDGTTTVSYSLKNSGHVKISLYDASGKAVVLREENETAGNFQLQIDGGNFAAGIYMLRIEVDGAGVTMPVIKK